MKIVSNWSDVEFFMYLYPFYLESPKSKCQGNSTENGSKASAQVRIF